MSFVSSKVSSSANKICDNIHEYVKNSNLDFYIQETPYSSYITIRKKFVSKGVSEYSDSLALGNVKHLEERNRQLEKKLADVKLELVNTEEDNEAT